MTGSRHEPTPSDDMDPTGVRAMLANLPDPGPMPEDLVARISQSLELEQRRRAAAASDTPAPDTASDSTASATGGGSLVSLEAERTRRRPGRTLLWLGGAAAVAMVATVSVTQLFGDGDTDAGVSAQYPAASDSADREESGDAGGADDAGADAGGEAATEDGALGEAPASSESAADEETDGAVAGNGDEEMGVAGPLPARTVVVGLEGSIDLSATGWADQVTALLASGPAERELSAGEGVDCLTASTVRSDSAERFLLSEAQWDDEAARLVVAVNPEDDVAWVLSADCREIFSGPVTLAP
ncbi:hypothetical protein MWU75_15170 [Ornithinimicrobium sp. F0845]|uniref:hypothetical protein n=1 Tax=Ornithinimicrobium sp. F0845 TaxID=2926412 RepID=UPI001FF13701|nr:hypothetical protein [Ornithinimicrobium sp. F0845]MCK0113487.1 hypothetical protein [Ornithinimicrobium sp. F0845]